MQPDRSVLVKRCCAVLACFVLVPLHGVRADSLLECLSASDSPVISPADGEYDSIRQVANRRIDARPAAIVFPNSTEAVQEVIGCARAFNNTPVSTRGGGHSYEGYSVLPGAVVVDTRNLSTYERTGKGTVDVGTGFQLGPLYWKAWTDAQLAFPGGTCPTVGIAGLTLGGGWGMLARSYGLASDHLVGLEMVDYNGSIVVANASHNADLLWASRGGGGGNFGIVTSFTLSLVPAPEQTVFILLYYPPEQMATVFDIWQRWAPHAPDALTCELQLQGSGATLRGLYLGSKQASDALLISAGLLNISGISYIYYTEKSYIESMLLFAWQTEGLIPDAPVNLSLPPNVTTKGNSPFKGKSFDIVTPLNSSIIDILTNSLQGASNKAWMQFSAYGGAMNRVLWRSTAFSQRGMLYNMQYYISWTEQRQEDSALAWINGLQQRLSPLIPNNAYVNYVDADLDDWADGYYTGALQRLQQIKAKYDPENYFSFPQSIPMPLSTP